MEHPILFSGEMVRAILSGTKTQTRRVVRWPKWATPQEHGHELEATGGLAQYEDGRPVRTLTCPFGVAGDVLWVREGFAFVTPAGLPAVVHYRATAPEHVLSVPRTGHYRWRPGVHMPREGSRLTLEVVSVRVERVQTISKDDARAEGVTMEPVTSGEPGSFVLTTTGAASYRKAFMRLWDRINGARPGCGWDDNPLVWAVEFRRR